MDNKIATIIINGQEYNLNDNELRDLVHQMMKIIVNNNNTLTGYINNLNDRLTSIENKLNNTETQ